MKNTRGSAALLAIALAGCTCLQVTKLRDDETFFPDGALPYALPRKSYVVSVTYVLKECTPMIFGEMARNHLHIESTVGVAPLTVVDPKQRYFVDYNDQRSWFKDTTLTLDLRDNKTLQSFNDITNDQVAPTIVAVIGTALKIAAVVSLADYNGAKPADVCRGDVLTAIGLVKKAHEAAQTPPKKGKTPTPEEAQADADKLSDAMKLLTTTTMFEWSPERGDLYALKPGRMGIECLLAIPSEVVNKWLDASNQEALDGEHAYHGGCEPRPPDRSGSEKDADAVVLELSTPAWSLEPEDAPVMDPARSDPNKPPERHKYDGLVVRDAALAALRVCTGPCPELPAPSAHPVKEVSVDKVRSAKDEVVPQFGRLRVLPLHNYVAENDTLKVNMNPDGGITEMSVTSQSTASGPITSLGAAADTLKGTLSANEQARAAARNSDLNGVKDANKIISDCLDAQSKIRAAGGTPIGSCQ